MTLPAVDSHAPGHLPHTLPCRACDRPAPPQVLSHHSTSEGVVVWARCPCGALQTRLRPHGGGPERIVATGRRLGRPAGRPEAEVRPLHGGLA